MESGETFYLELLSEGVYEIIGAYTSGVDFFNGGFFTDTVIVNSADYNFNTENRLRFRNAGNQNNDQIYFDQVIVRGDGLLSPSIPQMLTASNVQATTVDLSWLASSDLNEEGNAGTVSYDIFQDGEFLATTSQIDYTVQGLEETTEYSFYVIAKDEDGNQSFESETISVTTLEVQSEPIIIAGYYFEDSFEGWSDPGENCTRVNWAARSYEGQRSIRLRNGTETSLSESPILDFTNNNTIAIEFHTYSSSMEVGEAFYVELFNDGLYEIVGTYISGTHFTNGGFFTDTILLSSLDYTFSSSNRIRFRNAGDTSNDQIYFDQVIISGDGFYIPTPPQMLSANEVTATTVDLGWLASTDINAAGNSGTIVYDVYQDEQLILTTDQIDVTVTSLTENTTYSYYVIARDEDNSQSFKSNTVTITTSLIADELEEIVGYYFETGFEGWSDPGENCTRVNWAARSYEGQRSIRIKNGTETSLSESPLLDLSNNGFVSIEFHTYSSSMESGETFFVELFNNGDYEIIGEYVSGVDFANGTFYTDTILLSSEDYSFALDNRIRFRNTGDTSNDHIYFDQVIISGNGAATSRNVVTNEEILELNNVNYQTLDITLFPNPATSVLNIRSVDGTIEDGAYYTISNLVGQKISTGTIINNRIEINDLKTGVYFLEFNLENRNIVKKFIKK